MRRHRLFWMRNTHDKEKGLRLRVIAGGQYRCDGDVSALTVDRPLFALLSAEEGIAVVDREGVLLGRILNEFPLEYGEFRQTLDDCFGGPRIPLQFVAQSHESETDGIRLCYYVVKVAADPVDMEGPVNAPSRLRAQ